MGGGGGEGWWRGSLRPRRWRFKPLPPPLEKPLRFASSRAAGVFHFKSLEIMDLNSIRSALHKQPFQPFELCLGDGRRVPVAHPEFVAMNNRVVVALDERSFSKMIEPLLIV